MSSRFIFVVCQSGAEAACKAELQTNHPELKFSFSRPGFVTFKCDDSVFNEKFHLKSVFARTYGWSIGNSKSENLNDHIAEILKAEQVKEARHFHIWQRDARLPGSSGFEPGQTELAKHVGSELAAAIPSAANGDQVLVNRHAKSDELVFDIAIVEPDQWFFGYHYASAKCQRWPGGVPNFKMEETVVSRAYFKLKEAMLWSGIHVQQDEFCAEIGSSPGGACQLLLEKGAKVLAIDPAEMAPQVLEHESLTHLRCRSKEVRKKDLKDVRWLFSDLSASPSYTLDAVEEIVRNQHVSHIRGMILTLKLTELSLAKDLPAWIERVKKMGFQLVKVRQLAFNRREICLVAARDRFALRASRKH